MKTLKLFTFLCIVTLYSSCDNGESDNPLDFQLGQSFELAFGQSADCTCDNLTVTFAEVLEDSRCPSDVVCIWEGQARIKLNVQAPDGQHPLELISRAGLSDLARDTLDNLVYELLDVSPYPVSTRPIDEDDYRIELIVKELE